jgi:hypothetical protein
VKNRLGGSQKKTSWVIKTITQDYNPVAGKWSKSLLVVTLARRKLPGGKIACLAFGHFMHLQSTVYGTKKQM